MYKSGRLELIGHEPSRFKRKRKVKKKPESALSYTPFRSNFRWRRY